MEGGGRGGGTEEGETGMGKRGGVEGLAIAGSKEWGSGNGEG